MVKIKNIKINDGIIECDLVPEGSKESCELYFDSNKNEVRCQLPKGYEYCTTHIRMAVTWLLEHINDTMPEEKTIMWY